MALLPGQSINGPIKHWRHLDADLQNALFNHCPTTRYGGKINGTTMRLSHWLIEFLRRADLAT
jgi:hypothetical protein